MDSPPIYKLPEDSLHMIFLLLPLRQLLVCRAVSKTFRHLISGPTFLSLLPPTSSLSLLALRPPHARHRLSLPSHAPSLTSSTLVAFDPFSSTWAHLELSFLPFSPLSPVTSSHGLVYLWAHHQHSGSSPPAKSLVVCNPLTRSFRTLPPLGSAWSKHGSVLSGSGHRVAVLTELATLFFDGSGSGQDSGFNSGPGQDSCFISGPGQNSGFPGLGQYTGSGLSPRQVLGSGQDLGLGQDSGSGQSSGVGGSGEGRGWMKFSSNLPAKPRSPVIVGEGLYALCDVGSPWRNVWKMFTCELPGERSGGRRGREMGWRRVERSEWGDVFDILKRPRLVRGVGNKVLMVGGLKSSFSLNALCSTILILRLDLETLEWDEAGRMPVEMYKCFQESSKFKVFGGGDKVCFSAKRVGKLALWDGGEWRWVDGAPGFGDGLFRGFVFDAHLGAMP